MRKKLAVLISNSGTGTNLQAIIDGIHANKINATIAVVISDTIDALGLQRAKKHKLPIYILSKQENIVHLLTKVYPVDYIALAGWKRIIPDALIAAFLNKILNIHPGLIPEKVDSTVINPDGTEGLWNRGKFTTAAIKNFLDKKATYAGSSIHLLTNVFDFGPVIARCWEKIADNDTADSLYQRLKQKENNLYIQALIKICKK